MASAVDIIVQKRAERGGWDEFRLLHILLTPISKPDLPPRGGYRFTCPGICGVTPGMRAITGASKPWDVLSVSEPDEAGLVAVTLGQGDGTIVELGPNSTGTVAKAVTLTTATFHNPEGKIVTALQVECSGDTLKLLHDYPPEEFNPGSGWTATGRGFALKITARDGRKLTCEPLTEGASNGQ